MAAASRLPSLVMAGVVGLAFTEAVGSVHAVARTEDCPGACAMAPALECSDLVVVEKLSTKYLHRHRRGDVVMLRSPHDPREHLFARLVALEGDRVRPAPAGWGGLGTKEVPQGCCCVEDNAQSEMVRRWRTNAGATNALVKFRRPADAPPPRAARLAPSAGADSGAGGPGHARALAARAGRPGAQRGGARAGHGPGAPEARVAPRGRGLRLPGRRPTSPGGSARAAWPGGPAPPLARSPAGGGHSSMSESEPSPA